MFPNSLFRAYETVIPALNRKGTTLMCQPVLRYVTLIQPLDLHFSYGCSSKDSLFVTEVQKALFAHIKENRDSF